MRTRFGATLAGVLAVGLLSAAPASAGTVCVDGTTAVFQASDVVGAPCTGVAGTGETNALVVGVDASGNVTFSDSNPISDGGGGCVITGNQAVCPGTTSYRFDLGDGNDTATVGSVASNGMSTGGAGDDKLTGGPMADILDGGAGADTISGGAGDDTLTGGTENDTIDGGAGNDNVNGGAGDDNLKGGDGADTVEGGDGNDTIDAGAGDDTADGGAGDDTVQGGAGNDKLTGGDGNDHVLGGDGSDQLEGDPSTGTCAGSGGNDNISGDAGDDTLCAGNGPSSGPDADQIGGGDGIDHVYYPRTASVVVSLDGGANDGEVGEGDNVKTDVEAITGGSGNDTLIGDNAPNMLDGGPGADVLHGGGGPDYLTDSGGDFAADTFDGGDGDDVLGDAGAGPDTYQGGAGEDLLLAYAARSTSVNVTLDDKANDGGAGEGDNVSSDVEDVTTGAGDDTIAGSSADNQLNGGAGADQISGGAGNDGLDGGPGRDTLDGGPGRDLLVGGAGSDSLLSRDTETDRDECGGGTDKVVGDARDDISGDCENVDVAPPAAVTIQSIVVTRAGFVVVRITCPAVELTCTGQLFVKTVKRIARRFIQLGHVGYGHLHGGNTRVIRAKIAAADRRALRRARRVKVRALVTNINQDTGASTSATKLATVTTRGL